MSGKALFVGIGSSHGDDSVGWRIARQLAQSSRQDCDVRCAQTPADLLDWLEGVATVDVCDAVRGDAPAGTVHMWQWPAAEINCARFVGSHDLSLPAALSLAEQLGKLPGRVRIWGISIGEAEKFGTLSPAAELALPASVERMSEALGRD